MGFFHSYLRCLIPYEVDYIMREIHKGVCENHSGARSLVQVDTSRVLLVHYVEGHRST